MTFRVTLSETAARQLRKLPSEQRNRIVRGLRVSNRTRSVRGRRRHPTIEGTDPGKYRIRIGEYRAVYAVVGRDVKILEVFTRGRGYR